MRFLQIFIIFLLIYLKLTKDFCKANELKFCVIQVHGSINKCLIFILFSNTEIYLMIYKSKSVLLYYIKTVIYICIYTFICKLIKYTETKHKNWNTTMKHAKGEYLKFQENKFAGSTFFANFLVCGKVCFSRVLELLQFIFQKTQFIQSYTWWSVGLLNKFV